MDSVTCSRISAARSDTDMAVKCLRAPSTGSVSDVVADVRDESSCDRPNRLTLPTYPTRNQRL